MDVSLRNKILHRFPSSTYLGVIRSYDAGLSDTIVVAAAFRFAHAAEPPNGVVGDPPGLDGTFVVKIGTEPWASKEEQVFQILQQGATSLQPFLVGLKLRSAPEDGYRGVAYEPALDAPTDTSTLGTLAKHGGNNANVAAEHIKHLARALVDWNIGEAARNRDVIHPHRLLMDMLGEDRAGRLRMRLQQFLPGWRQDTLLIHVEGQKRLLPNPLAYIDAEIWRASAPEFQGYACPRGCVHGDLHTGNVLCLPSRRTVPKVIDWARYRENANPFYDLAYLEYDIIQQALPVDNDDIRYQWLPLLNFCMRATSPRGRPASGNAATTAWQMIKPIRAEVQRLQRDGIKHEHYFEIAWWLATVAVGLTFAQMSHLACKPEPLARTSALLYAAYGLDRALELLHMPNPSDIYAVPWRSRFAEIALSLSSPNVLFAMRTGTSDSTAAAAEVGRTVLQGLVRAVISVRSQVQLVRELLTPETPDMPTLDRALQHLANAGQNLTTARKFLEAARIIKNELQVEEITQALSLCEVGITEGILAVDDLIDLAECKGGKDAASTRGYVPSLL